MLFLALYGTSIFWSKNHSFLSKRSTKWSNPLGKCRFWHFLHLQFSGLKMIFSIQNIKKRSLLSCFLPPQKITKRLIFDQKPWIIPFGKWGLFGFFETSISGQNIILFIQNTKNDLFCHNLMRKKKSIFGQKAWKMSISWAF